MVIGPLRDPLPDGVDRILLISSRSEWGGESHLILRADVVIGPYITLGEIYIYFLENIVIFY